jgi:hypothetical protein
MSAVKLPTPTPTPDFANAAAATASVTSTTKTGSLPAAAVAINPCSASTWDAFTPDAIAATSDDCDDYDDADCSRPIKRHG